MVFACCLDDEVSVIVTLLLDCHVTIAMS